mmetsp:Transcript_37243/g.92072  ORF Transcript_37243/g.92072 Transcript_37243/m.92072 type:complete len:483 (-) Transcript_37243:311-1759(-)
MSPSAEEAGEQALQWVGAVLGAHPLLHLGQRLGGLAGLIAQPPHTRLPPRLDPGEGPQLQLQLLQVLLQDALHVAHLVLEGVGLVHDAAAHHPLRRLHVPLQLALQQRHLLAHEPAQALDVLLDHQRVVRQGVQVPRARQTQRRRRLARVVRHGEVAPLHPHLGAQRLQLGHVRQVQRRLGGVHHGAPVPVPRVVRAPVVHEDVLALLVARDVPVVLVVQVLVAVVVQHRLAVFVRVERLHVAALVELAVGAVDAPVDLDVHVLLVRDAEEVLLAVEDVEVFVEPGDDVPPALVPKHAGREPLRHGVEGRHGVLARVLLLLHAIVLADGARVERLHRRARVQVPALDLAVPLVRAPEARVEAHQALRAFLVGQASRQLQLAALEEALAGAHGAPVHGEGVGRGGEGEGEGEGERGAGAGGGCAVHPRPRGGGGGGSLSCFGVVIVSGGRVRATTTTPRRAHDDGRVPAAAAADEGCGWKPAA